MLVGRFMDVSTEVGVCLLTAWPSFSDFEWIGQRKLIFCDSKAGSGKLVRSLGCAVGIDACARVSVAHDAFFADDSVLTAVDAVVDAQEVLVKGRPVNQASSASMSSYLTGSDIVSCSYGDLKGTCGFQSKRTR